LLAALAIGAPLAADAAPHPDSSGAPQLFLLGGAAAAAVPLPAQQIRRARRPLS